jgi:hypothetical protein
MTLAMPAMMPPDKVAPGLMPLAMLTPAIPTMVAPA